MLSRPHGSNGKSGHVTNWLSTSSTFKNDYSWTHSKRSFPLDNNALVYHDTTIGNDVWIGPNAVIVGNIKIGNNVLIAPNAYVNKDVPDNSIALGNPAQVFSKEDATEGYINNKV